MSRTITQELTWHGQRFRIEGCYTPPQRGVHTLRNGDPGYPDEPSELEIHRVEALLEGKTGLWWADVTDLLEAAGIEYDDAESPFVEACLVAVESEADGGQEPPEKEDPPYAPC